MGKCVISEGIRETLAATPEIKAVETAAKVTCKGKTVASNLVCFGAGTSKDRYGLQDSDSTDCVAYDLKVKTRRRLEQRRLSGSVKLESTSKMAGVPATVAKTGGDKIKDFSKDDTAKSNFASAAMTQIKKTVAASSNPDLTAKDKVKNSNITVEAPTVTTSSTGGGSTTAGAAAISGFFAIVSMSVYALM